MVDTWLFVGHAGDTEPGRFLSSGLFRLRLGDEEWVDLSSRFPSAPQVRAIAVDRERPDRIVVAVRDGLYRGDGLGHSWDRLASPMPGCAAWAVSQGKHDPRRWYAGFEPFALAMSDDDGESWSLASGEPAFPSVTEVTGTPKRLGGLAEDGALFAAVEVGGVLRSEDQGRSWRQLADGLYAADNAVDVHKVMADGEAVIVATRIGAFKREGEGPWRTLPIPLPPRGGTPYCRALERAPDDAHRIYMGIGADFDGEWGALLVSDDAGERWREIGPPGLKCAVFGIAVDPRAPALVAFTSKFGEVFFSEDRGCKWRRLPALPVAGHAFALAMTST